MKASNMYASFFGLRELPFNNTPDPRFFFSTPDHEEALASLVYTVQERKGFVLLTGEVGAGKTLVSRMMLRYFGPQVAFATINHAIGDAGDLMESVCTEFELPCEKGVSNAHRVRVLHDFLLSRFAQDIPVVLVLDEAQALPTEAFEQLRMIGNLEADDAKLLQIVIVGQPELQQRFASPQMTQLRQRIFRSFHLPALDRQKTEGYIRHRLTVAGTDDLDVFDDQAFNRIHDYAKGLPRLINTVCDNALLSAYSAEIRKLDGEFLRTVVEQMVMAHDEPPRAVHGNYSQQAVQNYFPGATSGPSQDVAGVSASNAIIEALSARIRALEAAIAAGVGAAPQVILAQPPQYAASAPAPPAGNQEGFIRRMSLAEERIKVLEANVRAALSTPSRNQDQHRLLRPAVEESKVMLGRIQQATRQLSARETTVRQTATKVHGLLSEVRRVCDGLKSTSSKAARMEQRSRAAYQRLADQADRSCELAQALGRTVAKAVTPEIEKPRLPRVLKQAEAPAANIIHASADPRRIDDILGATQSRLADLRSFVSTSKERSAPPRRPTRGPRPSKAGDSSATTRLESQVQELVEMVGAGAAARK